MGAEFECIINSLWFLAVSGHRKIWFTETESGEGKREPQGIGKHHLYRLSRLFSPVVPSKSQTSGISPLAVPLPLLPTGPVEAVKAAKAVDLYSERVP